MKKLIIEGVTLRDLSLGLTMFDEYCPFGNIEGKKIKDCKGSNCKTFFDVEECIKNNNLVQEINEK